MIYDLVMPAICPRKRNLTANFLKFVMQQFCFVVVVVVRDVVFSSNLFLADTMLLILINNSQLPQ